MKHVRFIIPLLLLALLFSACAGMKRFTVQTKEPAQVTLPEDVRTLLVVNNVVQQPDDVGHNRLSFGHEKAKKVSVKSDSLAIYFTEALTQFLNEENFFDNVLYYDKPLRTDNVFLEEKPLLPEQMNALRKTTGADAIVSLDRLIMQTDWRDDFIQEGYPFASMLTKIRSTMRVYLPTMTGKIPTIQYSDSLAWEGFEIKDENVYSDLVIPTPEEALKELLIYAAEKMSYVLAPHWINQQRWMYTSTSSLMRDGENFANQAKWEEAIAKWEKYFNSHKNKVDKAKAASNIALAYEMLDDFTIAQQWIDKAEQFIIEGTASGSLERRRIGLYKFEIERRLENINQLNMQLKKQQEDDSYIIFK